MNSFIKLVKIKIVFLFSLLMLIDNSPVLAYVGGFQPANNTLLPLVGLDLRSEVYCSGAFVAPNMILTAAHCITGSVRSDYASNYNFITLHFNYYLDRRQQTFYTQLKNVYIHPTWPLTLNASKSGDDIRVYSDLAIIELKNNVTDYYLQIDGSSLQRGQKVLQGGFGMDNVSGDRSRAWGDLRMDWKEVQLTDENVFGFDSTDSKYSQQTHGDSGGVVLVEDPISKNMKIVGVNSVSRTGPLGWFFKEDWCARVDGSRLQWLNQVMEGKVKPTNLAP